MIKKIILVVLFSSFIFTNDVKAYTKEDIINLTNSVNICDSETKSLFNSTQASYTRLINTRNISDENLNIIYLNIKKAIDILNNNNLCNINDKNKLSNELKSELYKLFEETNNIILSSPTIKVEENESETKEDNKENTNIITDSTTNEIKIYENGTLTNVIKLDNKLNYVGLNKNVIITISFLISLLIVLIILKFFFKANILITAFLYIVIFLLPITYLFREKISTIVDYLTLMKLEENTNVKDVAIENGKIITYPSFGNKYGVIYINDQKEDIYFGDSEKILKKGIGQSNASYFPGEEKTTILSGHNTGVFKELSNLEKKDVIVIETIYGHFKYEVNKIEIVDDNKTDILNSNYDLIMYTCYPNKTLYGNKRIVVMANLIESVWLDENSKK